ncbi:hypothetical protein [Afipia sp. Root123D2]|uniref:hypothetical protein n=1 Tax=Afipia sp. Root123D2 TaxID=1736436 RepID=UPI0012E7DA68|nr:hypothetical protein [Afipia sp. Root123D2]
MKLRNCLALIACVHTLSACGIVDAENTFMPKVFLAAKPQDLFPDPEPDVRQLVGENPNAVFVGEATDIQVSKPRPHGRHWEACVAATVRGVTGNSAKTLILMQIEYGKIGARTRVSPDDWCSTEALSAI